MKVIVEQIGEVKVMVQVLDEVPELMKNGGERSTQLTGIIDSAEITYSKVKTLIKSIAEDIGTEVKRIDPGILPNNLEIEFNVGMSAQAGPIWVLSGKGEYLLKVNMNWDFK